jgi:hypothetical protein
MGRKSIDRTTDLNEKTAHLNPLLDSSTPRKSKAIPFSKGTVLRVTMPVRSRQWSLIKDPSEVIVLGITSRYLPECQLSKKSHEEQD